MSVRFARAVAATANTNRDGTGTIEDLVTGSSNGSRVDRIYIKANVATTAGMIRFFTYNGSAWELLHEVPTEAVTPDAITPGFAAQVALPNAFVTSTHKLGVSTHNAEETVVTAMVTDL